jgi:hypothetical protein
MGKGKGKDKAAKLPKKIAGQKVPKSVRKAGGKLIEAANSVAGRELIAAGLSLAAAAAAGAVQKDRARRQGEAVNAKEAGTPPPAAKAGNDPHEIGVALGKMAEAALAGLFKPKA